MPTSTAAMDWTTNAAKHAGELALQYIFGIVPPMGAIFVGLLAGSETWADAPDVLPLSSYAHRLITAGYYQDVDPIFIPLGIFYAAATAIILFEATRRGHKTNVFLFLGLVLFPMFALLLSSYKNVGDFIRCRTPGFVWTDNNVLLAERSINDTVLSILAIEFFFAIRRAVERRKQHAVGQHTPVTGIINSGQVVS